VDVAELRAFALDLVDTADELTMARFGGLVAASAKPDGTLVTEVDRAVEAALRGRIATTFPDHAVLGEEEGGAIDPSTPTWVIDPIDATNNYLRGVPVFATLVGVVVDVEPVVGVASAPALARRWDAAAGEGARCNGEPIGVSSIDSLADAHVLHGGLDWYREHPAVWELLGRLADSAWRTRGFGDFWMHLLVAEGAADIAFEHDLKPWDIAAVQCIVTEAGGSMTAWDGSPALDSGQALTTNGRLHAEMLRLLVDVA
jgi:histidinol-phosphatase